MGPRKSYTVNLITLCNETTPTGSRLMVEESGVSKLKLSNFILKRDKTGLKSDGN